MSRARFGDATKTEEVKALVVPHPNEDQELNSLDEVEAWLVLEDALAAVLDAHSCTDGCLDCMFAGRVLKSLGWTLEKPLMFGKEIWCAPDKVKRDKTTA